MQDSSNRGWDEHFVDTAWGEMHQLLDRELPISVGRGKRRRAVLLAAFFFLGLILGSLSIYLADSPAVGYFPIPGRAVALQSETDRTPSEAETMPTRERQKAQSNALTNRPPAVTNAKKIVEIEGPAEPTTPSWTNKDESKNIPLAADSNLKQKEIELDMKAILSTAGDPVLATDATVKKRTLPPLGELMLLPANELEATVMEGEQDGGDLRVPPVIASKDLARLSVGAELGANYYETPGYFGGLLVDYRLNGRWGLQSGLRYGQLSSGLNEPRGVASDEAFSQADQTSQRDPSTGFTNNIDNQAERISASVNYFEVDIQLQHLGIPLLVNYQLSKKWKLGAGVQAHYLLAARRPVQNSTQDQNYAAQVNVSNFQKQITGLTASKDRIDPDFLTRWNIGASLGAGFQPVDRWSFQLQYHYGFSNWLGNDRFFLSPTALQLSAIYRLNR